MRPTRARLAGLRTRGLAKLALWLAVACLLFVLVPSLPQSRAILASPLVVHDAEARGDAAYVMGGGHALPERLLAASDLYHLGRVPTLFVLDNGSPGPVRFVEGRNLSRAEWSVAMLEWLGVPRDRISIIRNDPEARFGTLAEARGFAAVRPASVGSVVVVTSPAHTRRARLAFRRALPEEIGVAVFAAASPTRSAQRFDPLWIEYTKLAIYYVIA